MLFFMNLDDFVQRLDIVFNGFVWLFRLMSSLFELCYS